MRPAAILLAALLPTGPLLLHADPDSPVTPLVATGDFNGDGQADIVEATAGEPGHPATLTVRLGRADRSFTSLTPLTLPSSNPRAIVLGDFNGDGNLDVIVGDAAGALAEFLGDGHGGFQSAGAVATVGSVVSIVSGHFTRDNKPGLVVSDVHSNSAVVLLGAGDGSFRVAWSFELPKRGTEFHLAVADFNQDGIADLVLTTEDSDDYEVMLGTGNGTFTYAPQLSHLKDPNSYCPT